MMDIAIGMQTVSPGQCARLVRFLRASSTVIACRRANFRSVDGGGMSLTMTAGEPVVKGIWIRVKTTCTRSTQIFYTASSAQHVFTVNTLFLGYCYFRIIFTRSTRKSIDEGNAMDASLDIVRLHVRRELGFIRFLSSHLRSPS
jgi:hypothetical protein